MDNTYSYKKEVNLTFEKAVEKTKDELRTEGFGILTEIDVKATLKEKLDVDFDSYIILGACNPPNAYKALQAEREIGLMLPCNVIVYEAGRKTFVSAILPSVAMGMIENETLANIAKEIEVKLKKVIDNIV
jgi:uncharacterized protein (DUF302 family)